MRLGRLDLIRYGHFTDRSFELPAGEMDFHIIFGPNEAGKSTALAAIEDLLFGIPMHSPYNFLHDYASMRIGASLENGSETLDVLRRKGNKDTLLDTNGLPISEGDGALRNYNAGTDRSFFERMFSLDHARLQAGGQEILEARDDVGQMLFSAGSGIGGLRKRLTELSDEADKLWSERRAKHRKFYMAEDKLAEAQKELREHTLTASTWRELKRAYEEAEEAYTSVDKTIKENTTQRILLSRIRRVFRDIRRKQELDSELTTLEDVVSLPEDAAQVLAEAEREDAEAATRIATMQEQKGLAEQSLDDLKFNEMLVQRADDIRQLHERRIEIRAEKSDLPKREAELKAAEEDLRTDAVELGWTETDPVALARRVPLRTKVGIVRDLLSQRGELETEITSRAGLLEESRENSEQLKKRLDKTTDATDVSRLAIAIKTIREQGDLQSRATAAEKAWRDAQGRVERRFESLNPSLPEEKTLIALAAPTRAQVQAQREREQDWKRRLRELQQHVSSVRQERDGAVAAFERTVRDKHVVTPEELNEARSRRNALWSLIKLKHLDGKPIPENQAGDLAEELKDLGGAFEPAMADADNLADRRFDHAEAAGRIAEIKRKIGDLEVQLEQALKNETRLFDEGIQLDAEWTSMWNGAPFQPLTVEVMLDWLDAREDALEAIEAREEAASTLDSLRSAEQAARKQLLGELAALNVDVATLENDGLNLVIERAMEEQHLQQNQAEKKAQLTEAVETAERDMARRKRELEKACQAQEAWRTHWASALDELGLAKDTAPVAVVAQIDIIDRMRDTAGRIRALRHDRIDMIKKDLADFEEAVEELVKDLTDDLSGQPAESAVLELENRLANAERIQGLRNKKAEEVEGLKLQLSELEDRRRDSAASIVHLKKAASVETNEALKAAIEKSDMHRALENERQRIIDKLRQDGDGKSLLELEEECEGVVIDEVAGREESIQAALEDLRQQQTEVAEERSRAREAYQAVRGEDAAALAAARRQEALTELREVAERYVRVKTSATLLRWAIERYRREKQAPLLKRAGDLFRIITGDSFTSLRVAFDEEDKAHLTGIRSGGSVVPVSGMSTGTADQLYLALRVAAIEDYLERADALPFVADDLLINFDDDRAAAGFRLLGELSKRTQVLFFTHHQHLVDIARQTLDTSARLVSLTSQETADA